MTAHFGCNAPTGAAVALSPYPDGRSFAFTVTDDPDYHMLEKIRPIYDFLTAIGMRTSVGVFTREATHVDGFPDREGRFDYGDTTERPAYRDYVLDLQRRGFEVFLHTASGGNDARADTIAGYDAFARIFGHDPLLNLMHSDNLENVYWGSKVLGAPWIGRIVAWFYPKADYPFGGDVPSSPYFWGDVLQARSKYVRLWGTSDIDTLRFNPSMPYHDPDKPYVNYWFSFSDGETGREFKALISDANIDRLVRNRGASIVYTHFATGFTRKLGDGEFEVDDYFRGQMSKLASNHEGWFVPAGTLLDRLLLMKRVRVVSSGNAVVISNANGMPVEGTTLFAPAVTLRDCRGGEWRPDEHGMVTVGTLNAGATVTLYTRAGACGEGRDVPERRDDDAAMPHDVPGRIEYYNMVLHRALLLLRHHASAAI